MSRPPLISRLRNEQWLHYLLVGLTFVVCYLLFGYWNVTGNRGDGYGYGCYDVAPLKTEWTVDDVSSNNEIRSATSTPETRDFTLPHLSRRRATSTAERSRQNSSSVHYEVYRSSAARTRSIVIRSTAIRARREQKDSTIRNILIY